MKDLTSRVSSIEERLLERAFESNDVSKKSLIPIMARDMGLFAELWFEDKLSVRTVEWSQKGYRLVSIKDEGDSYYALCGEGPFPIGFTQIKKENGYPYVEYSAVRSSDQGKGLGLFMYEGMLFDLGILRSSASLSKGSSALWKTLVMKYNGVLVIPKKDSPTKREYQMPVVGWTVEDGITYPMLRTQDNKKVSLFDIMDEHPNGLKEITSAQNAFYLIKSR